MASIEFFLMIIALSLSIIAVFFCVALFYLILILKRVHTMMDSLEQFAHNCSDGVSGLVTRISSIKDSMHIIGQGMQAAQHMYHRYSERQKKGKKKGDTDEVDNSEHDGNE